MLTKFLIVAVVFLEILKVPDAEKLVGKLAYSIFKRPVIEKSQFSNYKPQTLYDIDFDKILSFPIKKPKIKEPYVNAEGAIVLDIPTSKILYQKNSQKKFSMASLTKIMTALVVLENYNLKDILTVPPEAARLKGAKINLRAGEKLTVSNLLYGLLLYSGNDAAYTLASKIGIDKFVFLMNQKAKNLGLNSIHYVEPTGLDEKNKTTLKDLAFLAVFALKNPVFAQMVRTNEIEISSIDDKIKHHLKNTNRLLREYPGTFGVKTGYTEEAGHCLITAVERHGHKLLSIILKAPNDQFKESMKLLDWTLSAYIW